MRTVLNGDYMDTSMKNITALLPRLEEQSGMGFITQKTMKTKLKKAEATVTPLFYPEQSRAFLDAPSVVTPVFQVSWGALYIEENPLNRYPEWEDKGSRDAYFTASIEEGIAWQIRANRRLRNLSQEELAEKLHTTQSGISRFEDPEYGAHSLETLIAMAKVFDCALSVRFIPFSKLAEESKDLSPEALYAKSFNQEIKKWRSYDSQ